MHMLVTHVWPTYAPQFLGLPVHYHCDILQKKYFDPSKYVYSIAFDLLCGSPHLQWNAETQGDILESLLGYHWLLEVQKKQDAGHEPCQLKNARMMSEIINFVLDSLYRVLECYANVDRTFLVEALRTLTRHGVNDQTIMAVQVKWEPKCKYLGDDCIRVEHQQVIGVDHQPFNRN